MPYIGVSPPSAPLTSSDITDNIITSAKIVDGTIAAGDLASGVGVTDLQPLKSDLTALALREATNEASAAFNLPNQFIDTFSDDTNLGTQTTGDRVSGFWATSTAAAGSYETGDKSSVYTLTEDCTFTFAAGTVGNWVDGVKANLAADAWYSSHNVDVTGSWIKFDLGSGNTKLFTGATLTHQTSGSSFGTWQWQISNDNSIWTDVGSTFDFGGSNPTVTEWSDNVTVSRYIRVLGNSGTSNENAWQQECEFRIGTVTVNATGTLIQSANTVASAKTKVGGTILYKDNAGTATLGTDLKIYFSCDNGSNWTEAASYNAITPVYSTGIKQVRLGETTCTSGTGVIYKAVWANQASGSKETQLHGIGINY